MIQLGISVKYLITKDLESGATAEPGDGCLIAGAYGMGLFVFSISGYL